MRLLLDTHTLIWCLADPSMLSAEARDIITDGQNQVYVSAVSTWEMVIKQSLGKLRIPDGLEEEITVHGFEPLPISIAHSLALATLPLHHKDPFDRLLLAQAKVEHLTFVTRDQQNLQYPISVLRA